MVFAALFLPQFPLQGVLRFRSDCWFQSVAVLDESSSKGHILDCTASAKAAGICPGLPSPQALARCPALLLLPRCAEQEKIASRILLEIAFSFSPVIEETAPGLCLLDLSSARIADLHEWSREIIRRLAILHLRVQVGVAATPDAATLAARAAQPILISAEGADFLEDRSVQEISPSPQVREVLADWGIQRLGELKSLPKASIVARLGPEAASLWDQAAGKTQRLLRRFRPGEVFEESFAFEYEVETVEPLLFLLRRFLEQLSARLQMAYRAAGQMTLSLPLENGETHGRLFTIPAPTTEVEVLFRILQTHLEGLRLEHRPTALRLAIEPAETRRQQLRLFENPLRDPNRFGETLARLGALVGPANLGVPTPGATHQPGNYSLASPSFDCPEEDSDPALHLPDLIIGLPLRRWRPKTPALVRDQALRPVAVSCGAVSGPIPEARGPYRLSGEWWEAQAWKMEEWDVAVAGAGLYRLLREGERWFVAGCYDGLVR